MPHELIQGRGAFTLRGKDNGSKFYCFVSRATRDGGRPQQDLDHYAVHKGVRAIQIRLNTLGFRYLGAKIPVDGKFGRLTRRGVKWFQGELGLAPDGAVGPKTAAELWRPIVQAMYEGGHSVLHRPDLLWGMSLLESNGDPGAVSAGYYEENGPDYGLCQINLHFNPEVTIEEAFKAREALIWSALKLEENLARFGWKGADLQKACAVAAHNNPSKARQWYEDGEAPDEQIANYVRLVMTRAATYHGAFE